MTADDKEGWLFVCYGNSCRSILAEAITRHLMGESVFVASAGIRPLGHVSEHTLIALEERNISCEGLYSKGFSAIQFDLISAVINLTARPIQSLLPSDFSGKLLDHPVDDPFGLGLGAFRRTADFLLYWIAHELRAQLNLLPNNSK